MALKKPKLEPLPVQVDDDDDDGTTSDAVATEGPEEENAGGEDGHEISKREQQEALLALIEHRAKEVEHLRRRLAYYQSQLDEAEGRLHDSESKLARLRCQDNVVASKRTLGNGVKAIKVENATSPTHIKETSSQKQLKSRPELYIPAASLKHSQSSRVADSVRGALVGSGSQTDLVVHATSSGAGKLKQKSSRSSSDKEVLEVQDKGTKRKLEHKEHKELIPLIRSCSSANMIQCYASSHISSQHKRKLRSLTCCPVNNELFVTSSLDGMVNLWQIQAKGSGASLLGTTDCLSQKQRRWPEDIAWHPEGSSLVSVYSADGGDSQISVLDLNKTREKDRLTFLEDRPHTKGIINSVSFMPWKDACFVTAGSDHAVVCWSEGGERKFEPKALHRNLHSSAVMGVAGMQQSQIVMSAGADKRIIGFDVLAGRATFKHQIESKCMSVLPNPCDFNLFMVQTGAPERQLRLFDIRLRQQEIHAFGWKQVSSESQSALINQAWSPDGLYLTSGSADPMIHIFDIRFYAHKPSQSVKAHQKRVFKAVWHHTFPLLISISSDLNIGLHKIT